MSASIVTFENRFMASSSLGRPSGSTLARRGAADPPPKGGLVSIDARARPPWWGLASIGRARYWRATATLTVLDDWIEGKTKQGVPKVFNLKSDPFERAYGESWLYTRWMFDRLWLYVPMQQEVLKFVTSFKDFPARQRSAQFNVDAIVEQLQRRAPAGN